MRNFIGFIILVLASCSIMAWTFWNQEIRYLTPTPIPDGFVNKNLGDSMESVVSFSGKPQLIHFFNRDCPCSRFNMTELSDLAHRFTDRIDFAIVIEPGEKDDVEWFKEKYGITDITIISDSSGTVAAKYAIYSTPQAVVLDRNMKLYYKGNYNTTRYCTRKETKFVEIALENLLQGKSLPDFLLLGMMEPYGCSISQDNSEGLFFFK